MDIGSTSVWCAVISRGELVEDEGTKGVHHHAGQWRR
jgi:hypothetical protein